MTHPEDSAHTLLRAQQAYREQIRIRERLSEHLRQGMYSQDHPPFGAAALGTHQIVRDNISWNVMIDPDGSVHELIEGEVIRCA